MARNGMENIRSHVAEHAAYGGHDGNGGLQRPKFRSNSLRTGQQSSTKATNDGNAKKKMALPANVPTAHNKAPVTGPATGAGMLGGPIGTGSIGGK